MKRLLLIVLAVACLGVAGCGAKGTLSELRQRKSDIYASRIIDIPFSEARANIKNNMQSQGSLLLQYAENADETKITLIRQNDQDGRYMCFVDFEKVENRTAITAYNYVGAKSYLEEIMALAYPQ